MGNTTLQHKKRNYADGQYNITKIKIKELRRWETQQYNIKLEKKYAPALDNYGQRCFVRRGLLKMKCVCKTQIMPPPDHQNPVDMHTSIMCINILHNIKAVAPKLQEEIAEQTMYLYPDGRPK